MFVTNVGDRAEAGAEHPIRVERDAETGEPAPYVLVRANLEALIDRKSFYRLVELGEHEGGWFGVRSRGVFFPVIPSARSGWNRVCSRRLWPDSLTGMSRERG